MEGVFEGVLFGYSAYNFKTRQEAFDAIKEKKLGAVIMNPLGGGVIPQHPKLFNFLCREEGESITAAALRFLWDHPEITVALAGFETIEQLKEALDAVKGYKPRSAAELEETKAKAQGSFEGICTGCGYCAGCPEGIPVDQFMDTYNQKILAPNDRDPVGNRLKWHWRIERSVAAKCTSCGLCEEKCTQHLEIIKRLKEIAQN